MTRTTRLTAATAVAIVLFLAGALGIVRRPAAEPAALGPVPAQDRLLAATNGSSLEATVASLQERLRRDPDDAETEAALGLANVQLARVTADPSRYEDAEALLRRAAPAMREGDASAQIGLASLAAARHDFGASLRFARRAAAIAPYDGAVYGVLGDALLELGRYPAAFRTFQRMVDLEPGLASYARVSYARELQGDVTGAEQALAFASGVAPSADDEAFVWFHLGELAWGRGAIGTAAAAYRQAAGFAPSWVAPRAGLARVAWARGDRAAAIAGMREVVARLPLPEHLTTLAEMLSATGDDAGASAQFAVLRAQAALLADAGVNTDLEIALFEATHGDPRAAVRAAAAEWERRRSIHVADAYAWALHAAGRDEAATPLLQRAMSLGTRSASLEYHAGAIALALDDRTGARQHLRAALAINPWFSIAGAADARAKLRELRA